MTTSIEEALRSGAVRGGWEFFQDEGYFGMWCVREVGSSRFGDGFHVASQEEARALRNLLEERDRLKVERDEATGPKNAPVAVAWRWRFEPDLPWRIVATAAGVPTTKRWPRAEVQPLYPEVPAPIRLVALTERRAPAAEAKCDAAFAFIAKLVHMQSGQGWTRAVVREAAAEFLLSQGVTVEHSADTTPEIIARALTQETNDVGE
jgi:hypothetical protein